MQRPVEINQKKTRQVQMIALTLGVCALLVWAHYDELWPLTWKAAFALLGIAITGIPGLSALFALVASLCKREPDLLIYDDRIEIPRLLSRNSRVIHFADVKSMTKEDRKGETTAYFQLKPYLTKSDLPSWTPWANRFFGTDYALSLTALDMPSADVYDLMYSRFQRYHRSID